MNEEEKKAIDFLKETNFDYLDYDMCVNSVETIISLIEKLQKENEELENDNKYLRERETYLEKRRSDIINLFQNQKTATTIPIQKIKDKIEEIQKEYNKLDKQVDESIKSVNKDVSTYYENKERISIMQTLSYFIDNLQELIEEREEKKNGKNI